METFVERERRHYAARSQSDDREFEQIFLSGYLRRPYDAWLNLLSPLAKKAGAKVLDYGCGNGWHTGQIRKALPLAEITGIDISEGALKMARRRFPSPGPLFLNEDAHALTFPDGTFDLVTDLGTLSSLELNRALPEVLRVLKPGGIFAGIETFAHNPITNLKRRWNERKGRRTAWAVTHIITRESLEKMGATLEGFEVRHFGLTTLLAGLAPAAIPPAVLAGLEMLDGGLFHLHPLVREMGFKVVFRGLKPA